MGSHLDQARVDEAGFGGTHGTHGGSKIHNGGSAAHGHGGPFACELDQDQAGQLLGQSHRHGPGKRGGRGTPGKGHDHDHKAEPGPGRFNGHLTAIVPKGERARGTKGGRVKRSVPEAVRAAGNGFQH